MRSIYLRLDRKIAETAQRAKSRRSIGFQLTSIWSTPKNAGNHAKQIRRVVDNCTKHNSLDNSGEEEE